MNYLILVNGPIAAGKTTVATQLQRGLPGSSLAECDAIKRMIEPNASSEWRREVALSSTAFLIGQLLRVGRNVIAETHIRRPEQASKFACVARDFGAQVMSYLLNPPLDVCIERAAERVTPGIAYQIDDEMVRHYYEGAGGSPYDASFDTSTTSTEDITSRIISDVTATMDKYARVT